MPAQLEEVVFDANRFYMQELLPKVTKFALKVRSRSNVSGAFDGTEYHFGFKPLLNLSRITGLKRDVTASNEFRRCCRFRNGRPAGGFSYRTRIRRFLRRLAFTFALRIESHLCCK